MSKGDTGGAEFQSREVAHMSWDDTGEAELQSQKVEMSGMHKAAKICQARHIGGRLPCQNQPPAGPWDS